MTKTSKIITALLVLIVVLLAVSYPFKRTETPVAVTKTPIATSTTPENITLTGTYTSCIPRQDNFSKTPCMAGVRSGNDYYVLDFNPMSATKPTLVEGDKFTASGVFTPIETISAAYAKEIIAKGIFSVTTLTVDKKPVVTTPKPATPKPVLGTCYVGGCSGQVCSDQEGMASTCEYRPEYACYKKSKCERQASGQCGWTPTKEMNACLASSSNMSL